jgi:hypothetical protein
MERRRMGSISDIARKRRWREADARLVLEASRRSGGSLSTFARENGLKLARIWRWSARLKDRANGSILFHPVRVVETADGNHSAGSIEVVLPDGRRVRVTEGFAAADLARVLAVLEGAMSC